jgi:hypothetical protein
MARKGWGELTVWDIKHRGYYQAVPNPERGFRNDLRARTRKDCCFRSVISEGYHPRQPPDDGQHRETKA